jgi:tRNA threonylcarbamoyladenosine biosynthesis protein TsaB
MIENLLQEGEVSPHELNLIVYASGPGSFTGLRIGAATAKGISAVNGCPFIGIPTLDMLSYGLLHINLPVMPVLDAKKKRFYTALYRDGACATPFLDIKPEETDHYFPNDERIFLTGPHAPLFNTRYQGKKEIIIDPLYRTGKSRNLIPLGVERFQNQGSDPVDSAPYYLRLSEAELDKQAGRR